MDSPHDSLTSKLLQSLRMAVHDGCGFVAVKQPLGIVVTEDGGFLSTTLEFVS